MTVFTTLATREDLHDRLAEIDVPAPVIHGEADASIDWIGGTSPTGSRTQSS